MSDWQVFLALHEESKEGWVWVSPLEHATTPYVRVRNPANGRRVVCEQRLIDGNFRRIYCQSSGTSLPESGNVVVVSGYYRERLGLVFSSSDPVELEISPTRGPLAGLRAGMSHPSSAIRTATSLGILSLGLGILSVVLATVLH